MAGVERVDGLILDRPRRDRAQPAGDVQLSGVVSLVSDLRMFFLWIAGRLGAELKRAGVETGGYGIARVSHTGRRCGAIHTDPRPTRPTGLLQIRIM